MYLMQVKSPAESKEPWDYYKVAQTIPGEQAFTTKAESKCACGNNPAYPRCAVKRSAAGEGG
jgi:hypothetical protein